MICEVAYEVVNGFVLKVDGGVIGVMKVGGWIVQDDLLKKFAVKDGDVSFGEIF